MTQLKQFGGKEYYTLITSFETNGNSNMWEFIKTFLVALQFFVKVLPVTSHFIGVNV